MTEEDNSQGRETVEEQHAENTASLSLSLAAEPSESNDASLTTTHMSSLPSHLSCMSITNNSSSLHTCTASATSNQLPVPSHVSAVQETALPHAGQTAVYCRTSELSQNTASGCRNTASPDSESTQNVPISSTQTSSVSRSRTPDFTSIEIPQREYPAELREPEYDAVLISTVEDAHIAEVFRNILSKFITLEDGRHPEVCTLHSGSNFVHIQSRFRHMSEALDHSTYMFMIVTERFCMDSWAELQRNEALMESIINPDKRWCVIPVLVQSSNERKFKLPFGLRALKPVSVPVVSGRSLANCCISDKHWKPAMSDIDALFLDNMTRMLNERLYLKMEREKVQKKKLEKWIREEQMQRYVEQERERLEEEKETMRLQQLLERQLYEQRQLVNDLNTTEQSQGGLSESQQTGSRDEPPASSSSSSSSSSLQQQQQAVTHVHYVFHGPVSHAQFGNSNVMQHTLDTQLVSSVDESLTSDELHLESSLSSHDSYEVHEVSSPASLPASTETSPSCDNADGPTLFTHRHEESPLLMTQLSSDAAGDGDVTQPHLTPHTEFPPRQHDPHIATRPSFTFNSGPSRNTAGRQPDLRCSAALSTSPGRDGLPSTTAAGTDASGSDRTSPRTSSSQSQSPAIAVVSPFVRATIMFNETEPKTFCTPLHSTGLQHQDEDAEMQVGTATGNSTSHPSGTSQRRYDDDGQEHTEAKRVDGEAGVTSPAASDVSQLSINDVTDDASSTHRLRGPSTLSDPPQHSSPAVESATSDAAPVPSGRGLSTTSSPPGGDVWPTRDSDDSLTMPQSVSGVTGTSSHNSATSDGHPDSDDSMSSVMMPQSLSEVTGTSSHHSATSDHRPPDNCVIQ